MNNLNPHNNNQEESKESQKEPEGVAILIDGNNFCKNLETLRFYNILNFRFDDFIKFISRDRKIIFSRYYKGGIIRESNNTKSEKMFSEQQKLFANLEKQGIRVERGKMMKYRQYKKCKGLYPTDRTIKNYIELKEVAEEILSNYKTCYNPIILITPDFPHLEKLGKEKLEVFPGIYLLSNVWKEKGVDVKIAVDILTLAQMDNCQSIILLSSDSDLLPAVKKAQNAGKSVEYIGFGEGCYHSTALLNECKGRLLIKEDIKHFFTKTLFDDRLKTNMSTD